VQKGQPKNTSNRACLGLFNVTHKNNLLDFFFHGLALAPSIIFSKKMDDA
jgi:hypothetical protein